MKNRKCKTESFKKIKSKVNTIVYDNLCHACEK